MKFTESKLKILRTALFLAAEYEQSLIEAHTTGSRMIKGNVESCVPKVFKSIIDNSKRKIKNFDKLRQQINEELK